MFGTLFWKILFGLSYDISAYKIAYELEYGPGYCHNSMISYSNTYTELLISSLSTN